MSGPQSRSPQSEVIKVRVTKEVLKTIDAAAEVLQLSRSEFIRVAVDEHAEWVRAEFGIEL